MSSNGRKVSLDLALQAGSTSTRSASLGALTLTKDGLVNPMASGQSKTVTSGSVLINAWQEVALGHTYTINAGGKALIFQQLVINGTLINNGEVKVA